MSNDTQIIVLASQKGGSGKTTISGHLAVQAELAGAGPVALIDTDPQGSLAQWWNARAAQTPAFAQVSVPNLKNDIDALRKNGYRLIIIDTPPAVTSTITEVIMHADMVVVPIRPSPHDLRAVGPTVDIIEYQHKPLVFVVNSATVRARITGETAVALSQHGTVAPVTLHHRVDFAASMIDGRTVGEINPKSRSATEVSKLWAYLESRLVRLSGGVDIAANSRRPSFESDLLTPIQSDYHPDENISGNNGDMAPETNFPFIRQNKEPGDTGMPSFINERPSKPQAEPVHAEATPEEHGGWDGIDRRKVDSGPPQGIPERRTVYRVFGRRNTA